MAQATTMVVADQVPANHNYNPITANGSRAIYVNPEATTAAGRSTLIVDFAGVSANSTREKTKLNLAFPVEQTIDGVTTVHHTNRAVVEIYTDQTATLAEKQNILARIKSALGNAVITTLVTTGEPPC